MLIGSAAYLKICACGKHARIMTAGDQYRTGNLYAKDMALQALDDGVKGGLIQEIEIPGLKDQIHCSELPDKLEDIDSLGVLRELIDCGWAPDQKDDQDEIDLPVHHRSIH